jgi:hypothetical protein
LENFAELGVVFWNKATVMDGKVKFLLNLPSIFDVIFTQPIGVNYDLSRQDFKDLLKKHKTKRQKKYYSRLSAEGGQAAKMAENLMSINGVSSTSVLPKKTFKYFNELKKRFKV